MKTLTRREEEVMELLWEKGPMFVNEMLEFYPDPRPHFNTISTYVRGLEKKGMVSHIAYGPTHQYFAVLTRDDFQQNTLKSVVSKYFNNSIEDKEICAKCRKTKDKDLFKLWILE